MNRNHQQREILVVRQIQPRQVAALRAAGKPLVFVDVRQPWEHEAANIADSILIPLDQLMENTADIDRDKGELVVCYCHHGIRSLSAAALLESVGFANVVSLEGGIDAWSVEVDPSVPRY